MDSAKDRFKDLLDRVGNTELSEMEQSLIEESIPAEENKVLKGIITKLCTLSNKNGQKSQ